MQPGPPASQRVRWQWPKTWNAYEPPLIEGLVLTKRVHGRVGSVALRCNAAQPKRRARLGPVAYGVNACAINLIPPRRDRRSFRRGVFGVDAWRETQMNILTVNLVFSTVVFAVAAKLYIISSLDLLDQL